MSIKQTWPEDAWEAIDHYREGLYRIASGEEDPVGIALSYLGEDEESIEEAPPASPSVLNPP